MHKKSIRLLHLLISLILTSQTVGYGQGLLWETYQKQGENALTQGKAKDALLLYQAAYDEVKTFPKTDIPFQMTLLGLALSQWKAGQLVAAEENFKALLSLQEANEETGSEPLAKTLDGLAAVYQSQKKYVQAESLLKRALELRQQAFAPDSDEVKTSLSAMGGFYESRSEFAKAHALREKLNTLTAKPAEITSKRTEVLYPLSHSSAEQASFQVGFSDYSVPNRNDSSAQSVPLPTIGGTHIQTVNLEPLKPTIEQIGQTHDNAIKPVSWTPTVHTTNSKNPVALSDEERKLYDLINRYRQQRGLSAIPVSKSLSQVARLHVQDLATNQPMKGACGIFSWSDRGHWKPVCYVQGKTPTSVMWERPKELTGYRGYGYEIAHWSPDAAAHETFQGWVKNPKFAQMFINQGQWSEKRWQAIGVGIQEGYVVVWFGEKADSDTTIADTTNKVPPVTPSVPNNEQENHIIPVSWSPSSTSTNPEPVFISGAVTQRTINELSEHPPSIAGKEYYQSNWKSVRTFDLTKPLARPLKVYVESHPNETALFKPSYIGLVKEGLQEWSEALNGRLSYELRTEKQGADIEIYWVDKITEVPAASGITRSNTGHARIKIIGKNGPDNQIENTILHEIGHALGLLEHSRNPNDVMYPQKTWYKSTVSYNEYVHLSQNDIAAIQRLYGPSHKAGEDVYQVIPTSNKSKVAPRSISHQAQPATPLASVAPSFNMFTDYLNQKIKAQWQPPIPGFNATIRVLIKVDRQGNLIGCNVTQSSGSKTADNAALVAVKKAAPFLALPKAYSEEFVLIDFSFN